MSSHSLPVLKLLDDTQSLEIPAVPPYSVTVNYVDDTSEQASVADVGGEAVLTENT